MGTPPASKRRTGLKARAERVRLLKQASERSAPPTVWPCAFSSPRHERPGGPRYVAQALHAQTAPADSAEKTRLAAYQAGVAEAQSAHQVRDYARRVALHAAAFLHVRGPTPTDLYNAACAAALAGRTGRAYGFLHQSIERGWEDEAHMDADSDLESLRQHPGLWAEAHAAVKREMVRRYGPGFDPELRDEGEILRQWARLYAGFPEGYTGSYKQELRFTENGKEYWLALRAGVLPGLSRELRTGDVVELSLIRVGAGRERGGWEPLFLVEDIRMAR
jgi:hypothetical protein